MYPMTAGAMHAPDEIVGDPDFVSFREIDESLGLAKGHAFRAFKQLVGAWTEGVEFVCCDQREHPAAHALLAQRGRLYPGTVNAVLLAPSARAAIIALLTHP